MTTTSQVVLGKYNYNNYNAYVPSRNPVFTVANGENNSKSNVIQVLKDNSVYIKGVGGYTGQSTDNCKSIQQLHSPDRVESLGGLHFSSIRPSGLATTIYPFDGYVHFYAEGDCHIIFSNLLDSGMVPVVVLLENTTANDIQITYDGNFVEMGTTIPTTLPPEGMVLLQCYADATKAEHKRWFVVSHAEI